jgi:hypothetical protein
LGGEDKGEGDRVFVTLTPTLSLEGRGSIGTPAGANDSNVRVGVLAVVGYTSIIVGLKRLSYSVTGISMLASHHPAQNVITRLVRVIQILLPLEKGGRVTYLPCCGGHNNVQSI